MILEKEPCFLRAASGICMKVKAIWQAFHGNLFCVCQSITKMERKSISDGTLEKAYRCGMDDEDHLAAAAFNVFGAMLMENTMPEMQDLPLRQGKNTFDYFESKVKRNDQTLPG